MIRINGEVKFNHEFNAYVFALENGDVILIKEANYERIMLHESLLEERMYKAVVIENDDDERQTEYVGFMLI